MGVEMGDEATCGGATFSFTFLLNRINEKQHRPHNAMGERELCGWVFEWVGEWMGVHWHPYKPEASQALAMQQKTCTDKP